MRHLFHVYTGDGKGKTTCSMGLAARMLGHGGEVVVIQFMKQPNSGELVSLKKLGAHIFDSPRMDKFTYQMDEEEILEAAEGMKNAIGNMIAQIDAVKPSLTVLDEICCAMAYHLIPKEDGMRLIEAGLQYGDVVATGRSAPKELLKKADYISNIHPDKHPFDEGIPARKGIEW